VEKTTEVVIMERDESAYSSVRITFEFWSGVYHNTGMSNFLILGIALICAPLLYFGLHRMADGWERMTGKPYPLRKFFLHYMIASAIAATIAVIVLELTK
jgi:hypothetical protein